MTQKNCTVVMRSAILRNHLKNGSRLPYAPSITPGLDGKWRSQSENAIRGSKRENEKNSFFSFPFIGNDINNYVIALISTLFT